MKSLSVSASIQDVWKIKFSKCWSGLLDNNTDYHDLL